MLEDHPRGGFTNRGFTGPWWGVRTPDWHLVEWNGTHLYDLRNDPLEQVDVHEIQPDEVAYLTNLGLSTLTP
jgi:hypothetical protein